MAETTYARISDLTTATLPLSGTEYIEISVEDEYGEWHSYKVRIQDIFGDGWYSNLTTDFADFVAPNATSADDAETCGGESPSDFHDATQLTGLVPLVSIPDELTGKNATTADTATVADGLTSYGLYYSAAIYDSAISITSASNVSVCAMSAYRFAFVDSYYSTLRAYSWNGKEWSLTGSALSISGMGSPKICALSSSRVVVIDNALGVLQAYDFDGSAWATSGSSLAISLNNCSICALSSTLVSIADSAGTLTAYTLSGSSWSQTGSALTIPATGKTSQTALNSTMIALYSLSADTIQCYTFNGSTWSTTGNSLETTGYETIITALNATDIITIHQDYFSIYRFDGTDWAQVGSDQDTDYYFSSISALDSEHIITYDTTSTAAERWSILSSFVSPYHFSNDWS